MLVHLMERAARQSAEEAELEAGWRESQEALALLDERVAALAAAKSQGG